MTAKKQHLTKRYPKERRTVVRRTQAQVREPEPVEIEHAPPATAKPVTLSGGYQWRGPGLLVRKD